MEADGCFSTLNWTIAGDIRDLTMLERLSKIIGGKLSHIKDKNACILTLSNLHDITTLFNFLNGKLRDQRKIDMMIRKIKNTPGLNHLEASVLPVDSSDNLNKTHWLAGFTTGDGSFQVKTLSRPTTQGRPARNEVRLNLQVDQKTSFLLDQIKGTFGGNVYHRNKQDTYYYGSTSFGVANKLVKYFDVYRPCGIKWVNYLKWRSVWAIIQTKYHTTASGFEKIVSIKSGMNDQKYK